MRDWPRWIIVWGPVTRFYWAFPQFQTPPWLWTVINRDPQALAARMGEVERRFGAGPERGGKGGGQEW
jgi:hypothetical protein